MASEPYGALMLIGLGVRDLSMEAVAIPEIKAAIGRVSLRELEAKLPSGFERVHRRHIVNLAQVERLRATEAGGERRHRHGDRGADQDTGARGVLAQRRAPCHRRRRPEL